MAEKRLPLGISDFKKIIEGDYYYIDKSLLIKEVEDSGDLILLLPRPRRFGKTLNISMLEYFYSCCLLNGSPEQQGEGETDQSQVLQMKNYGYLFQSLAISRAGQKYMDKLGQFPVISISFKDARSENWESCLNKIKDAIQEVYQKHCYLLDSPTMNAEEKQYYNKIIQLEGDKDVYEKSLKRLQYFLFHYFNRRVVILIDEYDAPIHAGFSFGYYDEVIGFMRNFMSGGLKDRDIYLEKSVITGIMRIAKESFFSGFNNSGVYTILTSEFSAHFGFTEQEVRTMLEDFQVMDKLEQVQLWYNGYNFGGRVIYNPWSIISFLRSKEKRFMPYWVNTSSNEIMESLLTNGGAALREELEQLIRGEAIEKSIEENIVLKDIFKRENLLWSFLLMGGYLRQSNERWDSGYMKFFYTLTVPNEEVKVSYMNIIDGYFSEKISNENVQSMLQALIKGDIPRFEKILKQLVLAVCSYHDFSNEPEKVYHALVVGLLIWITNTHELKSNRESGFGRYDIMIIPKDITQIGYVIEFKAVEKDVESALTAAMAQIEEKQYETELKERGITHIKKLAIAFLGKDVFVQCKE